MGIREAINRRIWESVVPRDVQKLVEAIGSGMQLVEPGWATLAGANEEHEIDPLLREEAIKASYYYWQLDPLMGNAVRLIKDYTFGRGITWDAQDPETEKALNRFWDDRDNGILNKAEGQWQLSERIQLAGEVFEIFFVNRLTGAVKMRIVEPEEITQIITDPDDKSKVLYYERKWQTAQVQLGEQAMGRQRASG